MNKKLQVFVSSTYTDLIEERQAAVQAILDAGHIPAGMELFKAGKSQMETIHKWIDDSDVYMLILGGRYGSIEEDSGLSYTELEYKYAISKNMPIFAVVLDDSFLFIKASSDGKDAVFEKMSIDKYNSFKELVKTNIVKFVSNIDQISSTIYSHLNEISKNSDLIGWVRQDTIINAADVSEENDKLIHENRKLNDQINKLTKELTSKHTGGFDDYSFYQLVSLLSDKMFSIPASVCNENNDIEISALKLYIDHYEDFLSKTFNKSLLDSCHQYLYSHVYPFFMQYGLITRNFVTYQPYYATQRGKSFYSLLEQKRIKEHIHI